MTRPGWRQRFLGTTRGQILTLLRRSDATVATLAEELGLTDNAIRTHLAALERDGLIEQHDLVRGAGKPAYLYRLTLEAEGMYPKAYGSVLRLLMQTIRQRHGEKELDATLREVGHRLATTTGIPEGGDMRTRAEAAVAVLAELGANVEIEEHEDGLLVHGYGCPLANVSSELPRICQVATTLLAELTGTKVREACEHGRLPRCGFIIESVPAVEGQLPVVNSPT